MFTQIENPFEELIKVTFLPSKINSSYPTKVNSNYSNESSAIWAWILGGLAIIGGIAWYFIWKEKERQSELDDKNKLLES
jgi:hypothetical protein